MRARAHTRTRLAASVGVVLALTLGVVGCSDDGAADGAEVDRPLDARVVDLPDPVAGRVDVDGGPGTLTESALADFARTDTGTTVSRQTSGDTRAFQRLCRGEIDIVDSTRPLTANEFDQCRRDGLGVVQLRIAADATVLAIRAQTDVGTDCLSTDQLATGFRAGSEITTWSQLGADLDDVAFAAGGPTVETPATRLLGRTVLGAPEPADSDFRVDYQGATSEDGTRAFVTGAPEDVRRAALLLTVEPDYLRLRRALDSARTLYAKAQGRVVEFVKQQRRDVAERRSASVRTLDNQRVAKAYADRDRMVRRVQSRTAALAPVTRRYRLVDAARRRRDATLGHVGLFSQGYYTTYHDQLRPFEIERSDGDGQRDCILPSPQTILSGQYPLSRQLLLTVSTRALDRREVKQLLTYYLDQSQRLAEGAGVVPLPDADVARQLAWVQGAKQAPEFGVVDGRFRQLTGDGSQQAVPPSSAPPAERPAR